MDTQTAIREVTEASELMTGPVPYLTYHRAYDRLKEGWRVLAEAGANGDLNPPGREAWERATKILFEN